MTGLYVASNPTALSAQFNLTRNMGELSNVLTRLSTGLRINSGKDDPAGLIASELLKAEITGTNKAITNTQRANSLISTADGSLGQVGNLLNDIKGLVVEAANTGAMSADQIAANQLQVDASLESIDRISRTTTYAGQKLLDGSLDFRTTGANNGYISNVKIDSANFGTSDYIGVNVNVQQAASNATLLYNGTGVDQKTTMDVTGSVGTKSFTFGAGTTNSEIANAINQSADSTGVNAFVEGLAARGNAILSSAGANNDIVITAQKEGYDAGNYTFRIVHGGTGENNVEVMREPDNAGSGVVEIRLQDTYDKTFSDFAGLFNVSIDGQYAVDGKLDETNLKNGGGTALTADQAETSVSMTRGTINSVRFYDQDTMATAKTANGTAVIVDSATSTVKNSAYNGWTVSIDDSVDNTAYEAGQIDYDSKTIRFNSAAAADNTAWATAISTALGTALDTEGEAGDPEGTGAVLISGVDLKAGDSFTFGGGGDAGELQITYKEGATANDILKLANQASQYASVSLANGVDGSKTIANLPKEKMRVESHWTTDGDPEVLNNMNPYASSATANDVIALINSQLGDKFNAVALSGDTGAGRVSFMDGAVDYGSVNLDNALRFTGMDDGPLVRLVTGGANKSLGMKIIQPSPEDAAAGIHTEILEIQLATDAAGNSITSAKDIADLFDRSGPNETHGVSAEVLYPPGVDPNGRIFGTDECGNAIEIDNCPTPYGFGVVDPTGVPGTCAVQQNDLLVLGQNEKIISTQATARIFNGNNDPAGQIVGVAAESDEDTTRGTTGGAAVMTFGETSALNGLGFTFTTNAEAAGFDPDKGNLIIYVDPTTAQGDPASTALAADLVDRAIAANWEEIREYTGANGDWTQAKVDRVISTDLTVENALADASLYDTGAGGFTSIPPSVGAASGAVGTMGLGENDPVLLIKAKQVGTDMAGVTVKFVQNSQLAPYKPAEGNVSADTDPATMDLKVTYNVDDYGNKTLVIEGNMGSGQDGVTNNSIDSIVVANSLNSNAEFKKYFTADAPLKDLPAGASPVIGEGRGTVAFADGNKIAGITTGGYRVDSDPSKSGVTTSTSSGIGMTGQADANERLILQATDAGSENFVNVYVAQGSFATKDYYGNTSSYTTGSDVVATINGNLASSKGNNISINTADLAVSMDVANAVGSTGFSIDGGGALFQLGPNVVSSQQMRLGIGSVSTTRLGGSSGQMYQLKSGGNADLRTSDASRKLADKIVNEAISSIATTRGRLGAIQKSSLEPNVSALQDSLTALTSAESSISNADFAEESSSLTRLQLLIQAGAQTLGIANQLPQYAASLVR